jgi:hypothetical protein
LFNNCRAVQAQSFVNPQAGSHAQDQVGPFAAAKAEDEEHPKTEGEGEVAGWHGTLTPEEDKRLRMHVEACKPIEIVAAELKRSVKAVNSRAYVLRISLKRVNLKPKAKGK